MDLKERLAQFRAEEQMLSWEGTFLEYFEIVKQRPSVSGLAHARVHDLLMSQGVSTDAQGRKVFDFFKNDIFGVEKPLEQLVEYFSSAAKRLEVRKR
ncbi:MAG TPA: protein prkA, partial [Symbiobacteriaceae bacterium]|nr:protein prkA [Symbiobacteriaceae bacterium]